MKVYTVDFEPLPDGCRSLPAAALGEGITARLNGRNFKIIESRPHFPREGWIGIFDGDEWWVLNASRNVEVVEFEKEFLNRTINAYEPKGASRK